MPGVRLFRQSNPFLRRLPVLRLLEFVDIDIEHSVVWSHGDRSERGFRSDRFRETVRFESEQKVAACVGVYCYYNRINRIPGFFIGDLSETGLVEVLRVDG